MTPMQRRGLVADAVMGWADDTRRPVPRPTVVHRCSESLKVAPQTVRGDLRVLVDHGQLVVTADGGVWPRLAGPWTVRVTDHLYVSSAP